MVSASASGQGNTYALVIGDGIIGLSSAYALAQAGAECVIVGARNTGMASLAAAGLLLPNLNELPPAIRPFFAASLQAYPRFVEQLQSYDPSLSIIQGTTEIDASTGPAGRQQPSDGAIDNVRLVAALNAALADCESVARIEDDPVIRLTFAPSHCEATTRSGTTIRAERVILAAGAWAPAIGGLPQVIPVRPLKGQMLALAAAPLERSVVGNGVYLVPRGPETLVGATVENAGFDTSIDNDAIETLRAAAITLCPTLGDAPISRAWAGTRPATPDMFPILGADLNQPRLIYACGHSKNGILLAPATAACLSELALTGTTALDLSGFSIERFSRAKREDTN